MLIDDYKHTYRLKLFNFVQDQEQLATLLCKFLQKSFSTCHAMVTKNGQSLKHYVICLINSISFSNYTCADVE